MTEASMTPEDWTADPIAAIRERLSLARKLFHNSEQWRGEGQEYTPNGETLDEWIEAAFAAAEAALAASRAESARLASLLARLMKGARRCAITNADWGDHIREIEVEVDAALSSSSAALPAEAGDANAGRDAPRLDFKKERYGAEVATLLETSEQVVEILRRSDGRYDLIIHNRVGETDRWDDLSAVLEPKHFAALGTVALSQHGDTGC